MFIFLLQRRKINDTLINALNARVNHIVHLTHNDLDAVGADAIHRMAYGEIFSIFCSVGNFPQILEKISRNSGNGDLLSITDLGYQGGINQFIRLARDNGWKIEWRDHHRWEEDEIKSIKDLITVLHIDTSMCACGIAARDITPGNSIAKSVAAVVCDYDLWKNEDPRAAVLARVLSKEDNRTYIRDSLIKGLFTDPFIEEQYQTIQNEMDSNIQKSLKYTQLYGVKYRIAISPLFGYPSETAQAIRKEKQSEIEVMVYPTGRFSIRSVPPISHLIARQFQGGGHAHAAGGTLNFSLWDKLSFFFLKKTSQYRYIVNVAEAIGRDKLLK